jgi:ribokinase
VPDDLLQLADVCVPNETEVEHLTGRSANTLVEAEAAARALQARGARKVVLTLGERGVLVVEHAVRHIPVLPVEAVDTTGAGDAFIGSLAVFVTEGLSVEDAAARACAVAALSVTRLGAQAALPSRAELEAFLAERQEGPTRNARR